jgi:hypothetical protein
MKPPAWRVSTALAEQERPNIFTTSVANIAPGDEIDAPAHVEPLRWEDGDAFGLSHGGCSPYIAGAQLGHKGTDGPWTPTRCRMLRDYTCRTS